VVFVSFGTWLVTSTPSALPTITKKAAEIAALVPEQRSTAPSIN